MIEETEMVLSSQVIQLDWHPTDKTTSSTEVHAWLDKHIYRLNTQSYLGNLLRHFDGLTGYDVVNVQSASQWIETWIKNGIDFSRQVVESENLHAPYKGLLFRFQRDDQKFVQCTAGLVRTISDRHLDGMETDFNGLAELYCYRLKNNKCALRFTSAQEWQENAFEEIAFNRKTVSELRSQHLIL